MCDHRATVQSIYAAFGRRDIPAVLATLSNDVEWEHDAPDHGIPWLLPRRGRANVREFFVELGALELQRFNVHRLLADGDVVVALIDVRLRHRQSGRVVGDLEAHLWSFDAHGKVARFRHLLDTHQHWLALQP